MSIFILKASSSGRENSRKMENGKKIRRAEKSRGTVHIYSFYIRIEC